MTVKKVLVIRFSSLGDIILLTPIFRLLKNTYPGASVDFLTSTTFAPVCANNPFIDTTILFDRSAGYSEAKRVKALLTESKYDIIIDAHRSLRSRALLLSSFGPSYLVSSRIKKIDKRSFRRNVLLTLKWNLLKDGISQREAYCQLVKPRSELTESDIKTEIFPGPEENQKVMSLLQEHKIAENKIILVGPSASFPGKCWPKESFLELSLKLTSLGFSIVLVGGKGETESQWLLEASEGAFYNFAGKLSFLETAALASRSQLAISNDSAIGHFAEAVGTPAISIFGPTVREFGYALFLDQSQILELDLPCRPCSRNGKGDCRNKIERQCLRDIQPNDVLSAALQILGE